MNATDETGFAERIGSIERTKDELIHIQMCAHQLFAENCSISNGKMY